MPVALALATTLGLGLALANSARADGMPFHHTIPREVDAYDFTTGGPFMAPPVPNGHYSKDYLYEAHKHISCVACQLHALMSGGIGKCLLHKGDGGYGDGLGQGAGLGLGHGGHGGVGDGYALGQGGLADGSGLGAGHKFLGHSAGIPAGSIINGGIGAGAPGYFSGGVVAGAGAAAPGFATTWAQPSGQVGAVTSPQAICGQSGCGVAGTHSHLFKKLRCGSCGGAGCGACAGTGATGLCGNPGCGLGIGHSHGGGIGTGCSLCGGKGCGACGGQGGAGTGCPHCGGQGCAACLAGLKSKLAGGLGALHGKLASLAGGLHTPKIQYFLGPGGPVPITPGYVPYIVTTRSPRDFFSFAPMNPNDR